MKPLGRKYYKDKTGGKHKVKYKGRTSSWWSDLCEPSKKAERCTAKLAIKFYI